MTAGPSVPAALELSSSTPATGTASFWTSAPSLLKALAGLVTALAALLGALYQFNLVGTEAESATIQTSGTIRTSSTSALRSYVDELDLLLLNSGDTRGVLNATLTAVRNETISRAVAVSQIDDVIDDRRALLNNVSSKSPPGDLREARRLLREAIALSIAVDRAALVFVDASFTGNAAARDAAWREIASGSERATATKAAFTREYNTVRARFRLGAFSGSI